MVTYTLLLESLLLSLFIIGWVIGHRKDLTEVRFSMSLVSTFNVICQIINLCSPEVHTGVFLVGILPWISSYGMFELFKHEELDKFDKQFGHVIRSVMVIFVMIFVFTIAIHNQVHSSVL